MVIARAGVIDRQLLARLAEFGTARGDFNFALVDLELHRTRPLVGQQCHPPHGARQSFAIEFDVFVVALRNDALVRGNCPSIIREINMRSPSLKNR
jgi:hypothetical protein